MNICIYNLTPQFWLLCAHPCAVRAITSLFVPYREKMHPKLLKKYSGPRRLQHCLPLSRVKCCAAGQPTSPASSDPGVHTSSGSAPNPRVPEFNDIRFSFQSQQQITGWNSKINPISTPRHASQQQQQLPRSSISKIPTNRAWPKR
ncbi:hypothetical protein DFJ77DRAFT_439347 [Powellomyces hirtus]|nr:hypothetical protein DFJ77DRAFT_439347 [Powellomyces hirtus]